MTLSLLTQPMCIDLKLERLWEAAWLMHKLSQLPDVRDEKIAEVRAAIDASAYDCDTILDTTAERIADDLV